MMASMCMISFWLAIFKTGLIFLLCLIIHEIITIWDSAKQKSHQLEKFQTENKFNALYPHLSFSFSHKLCMPLIQRVEREGGISTGVD